MLIVSRGHLYRYHTIHQCPRCKDLFKNQEDLDNHIDAIQGCEVKPNSTQVDGITNRIKQRLQCRKKAHPGETEPERWKNIYNILFPNEDVPSPCKIPSAIIAAAVTRLFVNVLTQKP